MKRLFTALKVLERIVNDKKSFSVAINDTCRKEKIGGDTRKEITTLVGCALRHYLILDSRFSAICKDEKQMTFAAVLGASNILYAKKVSKEDTNKFFKEIITNADYLKQVNELITSFENGEPLINKDLDNNCLEFLSFRYNTPLWLVKMWRKHYGYKIMRKILIANSKNFNNYAKVNLEFIDQERFERENPIFTKTSFDKFYLYQDKGQVKKSIQYIDRLIYVYPMAFDEMVKAADVDSLRGIAAFAGTPNNLISALSSNISSYFEMDYLIGKQQAYFEIKSEKQHYNLKNVHLYEGQADSGIACFSKKVHTFFVVPESSKFFMLRNTPDYFIHFEQSSLDGLIQEQARALEECSAFVEDDGYLVYSVPTISEKETHGIVNQFLNNHPEFVLTTDKQIFPFTEYDFAMYYAVLRKVKSND